jgi:hypothetical protein
MSGEQIRTGAIDCGPKLIYHALKLKKRPRRIMLSDERLSAIQAAVTSGKAPPGLSWTVQELLDEIHMLRRENTLLVTKLEEVENG